MVAFFVGRHCSGVSSVVSVVFALHRAVLRRSFRWSSMVAFFCWTSLRGGSLVVSVLFDGLCFFC